MLGKLKQLKWTSSAGTHRDLAFVIVILAFGIIVVAKLAPYYAADERSITYNKIQTTPSIPKSILDRLSLAISGGDLKSVKTTGNRGASVSSNTINREKGASIVERPLFDGQTVILKVRVITNYTSLDSDQPIEASVTGTLKNNRDDIDLTPALGGKLVGVGNANLSSKRLYINFNELESSNGRIYSIQGQAINSENLTSGVEGDYSSGLGLRILGVAINNAIMATDQIGTAYLFSAVGPQGPQAQALRTAAMETNQEASQNVAGTATEDMRKTPAKIELPSGSIFYARIRATQTGGHR